jgi:hypothetical protein
MDSLLRSTLLIHPRDRPHELTLEIDPIDLLSRSTPWTHSRDRPHQFTLEIDPMDSLSKLISWTHSRDRPHRVTLGIDPMELLSRSTPWTHTRNRLSPLRVFRRATTLKHSTLIALPTRRISRAWRQERAQQGHARAIPHCLNASPHRALRQNLASTPVSATRKRIATCTLSS